jgi:predicted secreted Zn-dependent protease
MKRIALAITLLLALAASAKAEAMTCETLRYYASIYPRSVLEFYAKLYRITAAQRRAAYACLRQHKASANS